VEIVFCDFETLSGRSRPGDAVYFDPPYLPISPTAAFSEYHFEPFGVDEHRRLAKAFDDLTRRGVAGVLSNSDTPVTRQLFAAHCVHEVSVRRAINSVATRRGGVGEILVTQRAIRQSRPERSARA
jgi:DNA adenine methylase